MTSRSSGIFPSLAAGYDQPLEMLASCHERMRARLDTLARLVDHLRVRGRDAAAVDAARSVLRYFDEAAPHHHADEEQSLFPRLSAANPEASGPLIAAIEADHAGLAATWLRVRPGLAAIAEERGAALDADAVAALRAGYHAHIDLEERELIPLAASTLDSAALAEIAAEMAARRGLTMR